MKNVRDFKWIKVVIAVIIFGLLFFIYAQEDAGLFQELSPDAAELSTEQLLRINHLEQNPMNRDIQLVDIGNLKTLQYRGCFQPSKTDPTQVIVSDSVKDRVLPKMQGETKITSFPNPSSEYVHIKLDLKESSEVNLSILDMMGKPINMLHKGKLEKGIHYFHEVTEHYKTGFYVIRLATEHEIKTARIVIQKK